MSIDTESAPASLLTEGPVTLAAWDAYWSQREDAYELVDGIPTMAPNEIFANTDAVMLLAEALRREVGTRWLPTIQAGLTLHNDPRPTVRVPDFALIDRTVGRQTARTTPAAVTLVAETVSPTSIERDLVTKRVEYATAGIPAYLVIDMANTRTPLTLLTDPRDGDYRTATAGPEVTLHIDGTAIVISAEDLRA